MLLLNVDTLKVPYDILKKLFPGCDPEIYSTNDGVRK